MFFYFEVESRFYLTKLSPSCRITTEVDKLAGIFDLQKPDFA